MQNAWDYQGFMIDPYNSLIKEGRDGQKYRMGTRYDYQGNDGNEAILLKENDISIWLNVHASTQVQYE